MKLSDAIERGIPMTAGSARSTLFGFGEGNAKPYACALGTALLGAGVLTADEVLRQKVLPFNNVAAALEAVVDQDLSHYWMHPVTQRYAAVRGIVADLNDSYRWSREKIILWLRERGS